MLYRFLDYELDLPRRELQRAGRRIPMEPLVFNVLRYLVQQRHRVVSKDELLEQIWPQQAVGDWALIQNMVKVRRAVSDTGHAQRCIQTVIRCGYRFVAPVEEQAGPSPTTWTSLGPSPSPLAPVGGTVLPPRLLMPSQDLLALYEALEQARGRLATMLGSAGAMAS